MCSTRPPTLERHKSSITGGLTRFRSCAEDSDLRYRRGSRAELGASTLGKTNRPKNISGLVGSLGASRQVGNTSWLGSNMYRFRLAYVTSSNSGNGTLTTLAQGAMLLS